MITNLKHKAQSQVLSPDNSSSSSALSPQSSHKPLRWLVTGGCGFIGLNLIKSLIHKGYQNLQILDNLSIGKKGSLESLLSEFGPFTKDETKNQINYSLTLDPLSPQSTVLSPNHVKLVIGDIRDRDTCIKATEGIETVIHLAAHAGVIPSIKDPYFDFEVNALGTLNMLYASVQNKVERFIVASSNAPLGNQSSPLSENKVPRPLSPYGASKLTCEAYCSAFYGSYGLKTVILRFSNVYGPYCLHKESVIAKFIKDGISKAQLTVYGDGTQTRDFIHVEDLCHAISLLLTSNFSLNSPHSSLLTSNSAWGEIFHLGTGKETSILELAKLIQGFFDKKIKISFASDRKGEIKRNYSDTTKARKIIGLSPQISLKDGVRGVYEWFRRRNVEDVKNAQILSGSE